ncbi:uncharacterized protein N7483_001146 [Penicillium malachiteum]|uniref:uncharacterized protein n=1 Tax=Penicillium malachiteum TaxID=1324776 RepID=UPI002547F383|nr:uncharacterized protein N7483_001146 [Penicillium malachiteum]KAJ5736021.1 hypothetical protein N7483_001146 [Penicillium malachiteum]
MSPSSTTTIARFLQVGIFKGKKLQKVEVEMESEREDNIYKLQHNREKKARRHGWDKGKRELIDGFLRLERRLREITQREILLQEKMNQNDFKSDVKEVEEIGKELEELPAEFFMTEQERKSLWPKLSTSTKKGLNLWRPQPEWYLHKTLVQDCVDRGGCCGRACGCCQKRKHQLEPNRRLGVGHCTVECGCCEAAHGFAFTDKQKETMKLYYPLNPDSDSKYFRKIMLASKYGLIDDCTQRPFDLIDKPPKHEEIQWV